MIRFSTENQISNLLATLAPRQRTQPSGRKTMRAAAALLVSASAVHAYPGKAPWEDAKDVFMCAVPPLLSCVLVAGVGWGLSW